MDSLGRLLLRFLLVPLGYFVGGGDRHAGDRVRLVEARSAAADPDAQPFAVFGFVFAAPVLLVMLLSVMWLPAAIGVLISETFAIRSWIFHAGNGAASAWIGWSLFGYVDDSRHPAQRAASGDCRRAGRRVRLLGDRRLERGVLETGVSFRAGGSAREGGLTSAGNPLGNLR